MRSLTRVVDLRLPGRTIGTDRLAARRVRRVLTAGDSGLCRLLGLRTLDGPPDGGNVFRIPDVPRRRVGAFFLVVAVIGELDDVPVLAGRIHFEVDRNRVVRLVLDDIFGPVVVHVVNDRYVVVGLSLVRVVIMACVVVLWLVTLHFRVGIGRWLFRNRGACRISEKKHGETQRRRMSIHWHAPGRLDRAAHTTGRDEVSALPGEDAAGAMNLLTSKATMTAT